MAKFGYAGRLIGGVGGVDCAEKGKDVAFKKTAFRTTRGYLLCI